MYFGSWLPTFRYKISDRNLKGLLRCSEMSVNNVGCIRSQMGKGPRYTRSGGSLKPSRLQQLHYYYVLSNTHWTQITSVYCCRTRYLNPEKFVGVKLPNGKWNGVIGVMERREADVYSNAIFASSARMSVVDFLAPITQDR
jgi:hypothetical protein